MILLLTNDDGIDAPGLAALEAATEGLGDRRVIAPSGPQSGVGHAVTTHRALVTSVDEKGRRHVDGTPADCVRLALHHLVPDLDWVVSGINAGGNLGADVYHSGTVAAAREAVLHGRQGVALSHYIARGRPVDWVLAASWARRALVEILALPSIPKTFWSINLPHPSPGDREPEVVFCQFDPSPLPLDYRVEADQAHYAGNYHGRRRTPGADVDVCFNGDIAVSLVRVEGAVRTVVHPQGASGV